MKIKLPSFRSNSFNCPHCGTLAHQTWLQLGAASLPNNGLPFLWTEEMLEHMKQNPVPKEQRDKEEKLISVVKKALEGRPIITSEEKYHWKVIDNLHLSKCYSCSDLTIWLREKIIYPEFSFEHKPNEDMPNAAKVDFIEASEILYKSPRGACALLRLALQKICDELGQQGKNLNEAIGALVAEGLDPRLQKPLDVVRVLGNEAVHPGQIDLKDDTETASNLFRLINIIVDALITQNKIIDELYSDLPDGAIAGIQRRDKKPKTNSQ